MWMVNSVLVRKQKETGDLFISFSLGYQRYGQTCSWCERLLLR